MRAFWSSRPVKPASSERDAFAAGECAHYFGSIASHQAVTEQVGEGFLWDVAMLPVYEGTERKNSVVGGASLWTLSGKTEEQYRGAAEYFKFLAKPESAEILEHGDRAIFR